MTTRIGHMTVLAPYAARILSASAAGQSAGGTLATSSETLNKVTTRSQKKRKVVVK